MQLKKTYRPSLSLLMCTLTIKRDGVMSATSDRLGEFEGQLLHLGWKQAWRIIAETQLT